MSPRDETARPRPIKAESADVVAELGRSANVPFDRIVEAVLFLPDEAAVVDGKER